MTTRRRCAPIRLGEPEVVPISKKDYEQAVSALAVMIEDWWTAQDQLRRAEAGGDGAAVEGRSP